MEHKALLRKIDPDSLKAEKICEGSLGFYLFVKFLLRHGCDSQAHFLRDASVVRSSPCDITLLHQIVQDYLVDGSTGKKTAVPWPHALCRQLPPTMRKKAHRQEEKEITAGETGNVKALQESRRNGLGLHGAAVAQVLAQFDFGGRKVIEEDPGCAALDSLDRQVFERLSSKFSDEFVESPEGTRYFQFMLIAKTPLRPEDFFVLRVLGRGGFGQVNACLKATTGRLYALKTMAKRRVKLKGAEKMCLLERELLAAIQSPFVVGLKYAFSTPSDVYLVLDLLLGGDLSFHLRQRIRFNSEDARYFTARALLGLGALHDAGIVYRDLKPDNILLDADGRTKLSDLGLAARMPEQGLVGACGTRGYWAPEMVRRVNGERQRYGFAVDFFSLGCCLYEFLLGNPPFRSHQANAWVAEQQQQGVLDTTTDNNTRERAKEADRQRMDDCVDHATLYFEPSLEAIRDAKAADLVEKLLRKDPKQRLGGTGGYREVMEHDWFLDVSVLEEENDLTLAKRTFWKCLERQQPPLKPGQAINAAAQSEIGVFRDQKNSQRLKLTDADQAVYQNWDYLCETSFQQEVVQYLCMEETGGVRVVSSEENCCCVS